MAHEFGRARITSNDNPSQIHRFKARFWMNQIVCVMLSFFDNGHNLYNVSNKLIAGTHPLIRFSIPNWDGNGRFLFCLA